MNAQDALNAWGRKAYPDAPAGNFTIEYDYDEGCPTCGSGSIEVNVRVDGRLIAERYDRDFGTLLAEIIEAAQL